MVNGRSSPSVASDDAPAVGLRPSPLDGRATTSSGMVSLDNVLGGHFGLPLGSSLLVQETGTTDYAGVVLRYFSAEGLVQGHHVHVLGYTDDWKYDLPGLSSPAAPGLTSVPNLGEEGDKMKIAWRYGAMGGDGTRSSDALKLRPGAPTTQTTATFCHSYDLSKRLEPRHIKGQLDTYPLNMSTPVPNDRSLYGALAGFLERLGAVLAKSPPTNIHRICVPNLLSPTLDNAFRFNPADVVKFLHGLRALLRQFTTKAVAMLSLPTALFPRSTGFVRWVELLNDGVLELVSHNEDKHAAITTSSGPETIQGLIRLHKLPVHTEKGGFSNKAALRGDLSFRLSLSTGLVIKVFSLPPVGPQTSDAASSSTPITAQSDDFGF